MRDCLYSGHLQSIEWRMGWEALDEETDLVDELLESSRSRKQFSLGDFGHDNINRYSCIIQTVK